ncbi:hypothetical protein KM043_015926 [Ampulex compressa]|nr:hypothetical protein KM043_015926 [Ampulex compressa]
MDTCQVTECTDQNVWCLDSGSTSHICKDIKSFTEISRHESSALRLASDTSAEIKGRGIATIATITNGKKSDVILKEALLVSKLRTNQLSVSKIMDRGHKVVFDNRKAAIIDPKGHVILMAKGAGDLYLVNGDSPYGYQNVETSVNNVNKPATSASVVGIWHRRLGRLNLHGLVRASRNEAIRAVNIKHEPNNMDCEVCIQEKMAQASFPKESGQKTIKLELIHAYICGPMRVLSNGGSRHFITFTDDCTRWTKMKFIKSKDQVLKKFKACQAFAEKAT